MRLSTRKSLWLAASFGLSRLLCASLPAQTTSAGALPFTPALSPGEKENHASRITNPAASTTNSPTPLPSSNVRLSVLPQLPEVKPPVEFFRELLALEPEERSKRLADRSPESRKLVMAKVRQYLALKPDERELRLRVTELRWYLMPLLSAVATNRAAQLAEIPEPDRKSVTDRLQQWDKLPTNLQKELLEHEATLRYFTEIQGATEAQRHDMLKTMPAARQEQLLKGLEKWAALSEEQRQKLMARFSQFFELRPQERDKALKTLSEPERKQLETTLRAYSSLSLAQRAQCVRSFKKFAGLSPDERRQFLKNAERWEQMSPAERQSWRDLVYQMPLLPPEIDWPPLPHVPAPRPSSRLMATNGN